MEVSNVYIEDNSTLTRYLFNFCLYLDKDSAQNCTSGNFSSLPQQSKNYFLTAFEESSHQRSRQGNTTVDISPQTSNILIIFAVLTAPLVVMLTMFVLIRCMSVKTKRWERKARITIPGEEINMDAHNHCLLKTDGTVNLTDIESCATERQDLLKDTESRSSVETFGEYDFVPSETPSPKSSIIFRYQMKDEVCRNTKEEVNANPMSEAKNENNIQIHTEAATPKLLFKRNDTALGHNVMKCEVMHVRSPGCRSNQEDSNDDNHDDYDNDDKAVAPVDRSIDLQNNADKDSKRYDWNKIFLRLVEKHIKPREYVMFFIKLLTNAGCENEDIVISTIEEQTMKNIPMTIFKIFKYWEQLVGLNINQQDIECVFKEMKWNLQLDEFRNYMRDPPILSEGTKWHEPLNELDIGQMHLEGPLGLVSLMSIPQERIPADCSFEMTDEIIVQQNHNKYRRRRIVIQNKHEKERLRKAKVRKNVNRSNERMRQWTSSSNSSCTSAPFTSVSNSESGYGSCSSETARCNKHSESSNVHKSSADEYKQYQMTQETRQTSVSPNGHDHNESELLNEHEHAKSETLNGHEHNKSKTVIGHVNCTCKAKYGHEYFTNEATNGETLFGHAHHTNEALTGHEEIGMQNQTSVLQNNSSCKSTSSSWCVSLAKSNTLSKNLLKESNEQNRKRHIPYTDSNPLYHFKRRKKSVENLVSFERKYKNAARQNRHFLTHLVELVHQSFESKVPVDLEKYDIFINHLINRLAERPQKDDIKSLRLQSFVAVNCFTTQKGETIGVIDSENHLLILREKEWKYLNTYVKYARPIMKKKQPDLNTDFLFLSYNGEPLVHAQ